MKLKKILFFLTLLFIAFTTTAGIYTYTQLNKIKNVKISKTNEDLGIAAVPQEYSTELSEEPLKENYKPEDYSKDIKSIALFGIDVGRDKYDLPHSDSIIIATIDPVHKKIKLSSIMRDTYVKINGHGRSKITDAYAFGGPQLALRTINENFGLDVRDYMTVNFFTLEKIIDILDGVTVDVKASELDELNFRIKESAQLQSKPETILKGSGVQNLNGLQAVAYCRIRKVGSGDFERTSRQRIVLNELFNKVQARGILSYPLLASEIFPMLETSLSKSDILKLGSQVLTTGISNVEQQRFPQDGYCKGEVIKGIWYLTPKPNMDKTKEQISKYIYKDIQPVPKAPLF